MEPARVTLVPHTHWDREWYQPFEAFLEQLVDMMDGLLDLLDDGFPHFHLDGQVAMIDDYLDVRPDQEPRIRRLVREGKLSAGPWYTQMDEFLVSGESLVRNLEWGLGRADELGGALRVGYLPDQFGHVGQMPQILRNAGVDRAVVWRGVPAAIDRTAFRWDAPDGSRVLTEYLPFGYSIGMHIRDRERPEELAGALRDAISWLEPMSVRDDFLVTAGSDHHGPDATLPERLRVAAEVEPKVEARIGSIADHVLPDVEGEPPVWRGELRSAARAHLLPNVYSNRTHQKRERARLEALLERYAEPLAALVPEVEWPAERLDRAWRLLLWNGAHDSVCGCSVDEVARAVDGRYAEARRIAEVIADEVLARLGEQVAQAGELVFNPSPFERHGVPGPGWRIDPPAPEHEPVSITVENGKLHIDGVELRFLDEPDGGDLYNFCPLTGAEPRGPERIDGDGSSVVVKLDGTEIGFDVERVAGEPFVRLRGVIRNARPNHRLRLHVSLPEPVGRVIAGAPFELVERGLVSEGSELEAPSPTWPARGVVMAGGVAVLTEGVFEYEVVDGRELAVTLLRCVGTISRPWLATRPMTAGPDIGTPDAQMIGQTEFSLAIRPNATRDGLLHEWERFALPMRTVVAPGGGTLPSSGTLLEISGAQLSSIRRVDGQVEVRVWNDRAKSAEATIEGERTTLRPAEIRTIRIDQPARSRRNGMTAP